MKVAALAGGIGAGKFLRGLTRVVPGPDLTVIVNVADDIVMHVPELRRYARQLTRDNTAADDLLQETLTRALNKLHLYDPSGSFE